MTDTPRPPTPDESRGTVNAQGGLAATDWLSGIQPALALLFISSTVAFLVMAAAWRGGRLPGVETPLEVPPIPTQTFWLVLAAATSLASLLGMVSNTIFGWRKERREARAEALERQRQELEIQKLQLELEREKASNRLEAGRADPHVVPGHQVGAPPSPEVGERSRLRDVWSELDREYQRLTRQLAAVDKDLGQALDSERQLVLQEHRNDLETRREAVASEMAEVERRLVALGADQPPAAPQG